MKLTLQQVSDWFGNRIAYQAWQYRLAHHDPEDIVQEVMLIVSNTDLRKEPTLCKKLNQVLPVNPAHVNRLIVSRTLDVCRRDRIAVRHDRHFTDLNSYRIESHTDVSPLDTVVGEETVMFYLNILKNALSDQEFHIVKCLVDPCQEIVSMAIQDNMEAEADSGLRMNVSQCKIFAKHISKHLGVSKATVSRAITKAKNILSANLLTD